jgi:hypothetical protein
MSPDGSDDRRWIVAGQEEDNVLWTGRLKRAVDGPAFGWQ